MINIKIDSRKVIPGDTFVAIKGNNVDGHDFIESAIKNGATKIISEKKISCSVDIEIVENTEKWLNEYIVGTYKNQINELNIIGITGTNGKTTTAYLTYQMLNKLNSKTAYIGTIGFYLPEEETIELPNTTPNILDLYELLLEAKNKGCKNVVMEVSSHALELGRVEGITFKVAAFTNLTQDHLDFHLTMDNYLNAKMLILKQLNGPIIINSDDASSHKWFLSTNNYNSLGFKGNDYKILNFEDTENGTLIELNINGKILQIETNLKSKFNVYNYLTAFAIINNLNYSADEIINITPQIYPPRGRCEQIKVNNGIAVIDYAHTPDAVEKIIEAFSQNKKGKIITIIGCGGDRDPRKRPVMGKIATEKSDYVIFTSDNPRTENPNLILDDILKGVNKNNYEVEIDRISAINKALDMINENDVVLILGKGHEDYQIIGTSKIHLDDKEEVEKYIKNKKSKN